jgi:hypothetical protein
VNEHLFYPLISRIARRLRELFNSSTNFAGCTEAERELFNSSTNFAGRTEAEQELFNSSTDFAGCTEAERELFNSSTDFAGCTEVRGRLNRLVWRLLAPNHSFTLKAFSSKIDQKTQFQS